jgi:hypothetical protein
MHPDISGHLIPMSLLILKTLTQNGTLISSPRNDKDNAKMLHLPPLSTVFQDAVDFAIVIEGTKITTG